MLQEHEQETTVALSTGDVTSGLGRRLASKLTLRRNQQPKKPVSLSKGAC
jgi:hypothetical protein